MKTPSHKRPRSPGAASLQKKVLESVLLNVPFDGWTEVGYARSLKTVGLARGKADLLWPRGIRDMIDLFLQMADDSLVQAVSLEPGFERFRVRDKIGFGLRARLTAITPHREALRRLMAWYAMPFHLPLGIKRLFKTADLMWRVAGDGSTDFNFYTKRLLLAGVVKVTTLYWLDDETPGSSASWAFLDRRISEVLKVGKSVSLAREWKPSEIADFVRRKIRRAS